MTKLYHFAVEKGQQETAVELVTLEIEAAGWTIAVSLGRMGNLPRNWPGSSAAVGGDPMTPGAAPVDGDDAEVCLETDGGVAGQPLSTGLRSTWSAKPEGWDSPSKGSAVGRTPDAGELLVTGQQPAVARTG